MAASLNCMQMARDEINKTFGPDFAKQHPEVVIAVMNAASSDWAAVASCRCHRAGGRGSGRARGGAGAAERFRHRTGWAGAAVTSTTDQTIRS
jgi:hypothetical protein